MGPLKFYWKSIDYQFLTSSSQMIGFQLPVFQAHTTPRNSNVKSLQLRSTKELSAANVLLTILYSLPHASWWILRLSHSHQHSCWKFFNLTLGYSDVICQKLIIKVTIPDNIPLKFYGYRRFLPDSYITWP